MQTAAGKAKTTSTFGRYSIVTTHEVEAALLKVDAFRKSHM